MERGSGGLLLLPRCRHIGAAQAVLGSDRWSVLGKAGMPRNLAVELGLLLQVFVPAFSLPLPLKGINCLKKRKPEALPRFGLVARGERELLSLSSD